FTCLCIERDRVAATKPIFGLSQHTPASYAGASHRIRITCALLSCALSAARSATNLRSPYAAAIIVSCIALVTRENGGLGSDLIHWRLRPGFGTRLTRREHSTHRG